MMTNVIVNAKETAKQSWRIVGDAKAKKKCRGNRKKMKPSRFPPTPTAIM